ncbi:MAG: succinate dehydrogenase [Chloroflexi bacterium]|nr:succinate dehydrogenase [Chloroflexota bacterium]MBK6711592.1 succinate dehydrogenase [Chloroflexota bacterium]MBK7177194.1 succinate dehydrogenase [Chloroflexota bacterium]MBK7919217.1 succinate dehydrogenase [Chloroflexota bacterium]MBK8931417.1 succinate dehydrogenase [Chloroflexota bacterium]
MTTANVTGVTHRKVQVQSNLERWAFLFMRVSGIALLVLAVGHMMIQHVLNSSSNLTIMFVAERWNLWGWKVFDMLLLAFAYMHGMNGFRNVLEDYIHNRQTVKIVNTILVVFAVITILWAGFAIASFDSAPFLGN